MAGFQFVSPDIAVDIGTDNTRVYVKDKGIVVNEPSVVITRGDNTHNNIVAVGDSAEEMIGRSGGNIRVIHPLRDGVIVDYETAQIMIHYFVSKAIGTRRFVRPRVVVTMPGDVSKVERRAVINTMEKSVRAKFSSLNRRLRRHSEPVCPSTNHRGVLLSISAEVRQRLPLFRWAVLCYHILFGWPVTKLMRRFLVF